MLSKKLLNPINKDIGLELLKLFRENNYGTYILFSDLPTFVNVPDILLPQL